MTLGQKINKILDFLLDLIFPKKCFGCKVERVYLCQSCLENIPLIDKFSCPICQRLSLYGQTCENCRRKTYLTGIIFASFYKTPVLKELIHSFKYEFVKELAKPLAKLLIKIITNSQFLLHLPCPFSDVLLIPVPLHRKKMIFRGFNQAELIAWELAKEFGLILENNVLIKTKNTVSQTDLKEEKRKINVKDAFEVINKKEIKGKIIFLIDDVVTTGTTLNEAAKVLKEAGAKEVWGLAVVKG